MPKRSTSYPSRVSTGEQKMNSHKQYGDLVQHPSMKNIFTRKPYAEVEVIKK